VAVTALNFTAAFDYIGGAVNNQLQMRPTGGPSMNAFVTGITYANGPLAIGIEYGNIQHQGDPTLVGVSQRNEQQFGIGGRYSVAPGLALAAEYMYMFRHQGGFNFNTGTVGTTSNGQGQGVVLSTILTW
jgi:predicted porin